MSIESYNAIILDIDGAFNYFNKFGLLNKNLLTKYVDENGLIKYLKVTDSTQGGNNMSEFSFRNHISNKNNSYENIIHLAPGQMNRFHELRRIFPKIIQLNGYQTFCKQRSSGKKYTENPSLATCPECLKKAEEYEYKISTTSDGGGKVSKKSIEQITNWIPDGCEIIITKNKVSIIDKATEEKFTAKNIGKASEIILDKFFKPFSPEDVVSNQAIMQKNLFDYNKNLFTIKGINYNSSTNKFDGLILQGKNNSTLCLTFDDLFKSGFNFEDGSPCGKINNNRKASSQNSCDLPDFNII